MFWLLPAEDEKDIPANVPRYTESEMDLYCASFEGLWFYFPVPFKKGDIVTLKQFGYPIVVDNIIFPDESEKESFLKRKKECGDNSDMVVWGYFINGCKDSSGNEFLGLSQDYFRNYMDVEYYKGELTGFNKCLKPVSAFLKNEITLDLAITSYHSIFTRENAERYKSLMYTEEGMEIAGLKK